MGKDEPRKYSMTLPARVFAPLLALGALLSAALLSGCSDRESDQTVSQMELWIPSAAAKAFPLAADAPLPRPVGAGVVASRGEVSTPIGAPWAERSHTMFSISRLTVGQKVLARTLDGHFYSATFEWRDDVVIDQCVQSPGQCTKFIDAQALSVDEAKAMLRNAPQFNPALYERFFGVLAAGGEKA